MDDELLRINPGPSKKGFVLSLLLTTHEKGRDGD
jgi:hypothetical protein